MFNKVFKYPSVLESENQMIEDIKLVLKEHDICETITRTYLLVISEAFTNAMIHGNGLNPNKEIKLNLTINENKFSVDIIDQGDGGLQKINNRKPSSIFAEGGRGIELIKYFSDSVDYTELEKGGLKVSIKFSRNKEKAVSKC